MDNKGLTRVSATGIISAAGAVVAASTVLGFFGGFSWFCDLFSHFRAQYLWGLIVVSGVLLLLKSWKWALAFLPFILVNLALIIPLYLPIEQPETAGARQVRAMLFNVNTYSGDKAQVAERLAEYDPDFVLLEEVSAEWLEALGPVTDSYAHSIVSPRGDNFGIALFSKLPFVTADVVEIGSSGVPSIIAEIDTGDRVIKIIGIHPVPPKGGVYAALRDEQLAEIPKYVTESDIPVLMLGDINTTQWGYHFRKLIRDSGLKDSTAGRGAQVSWPAGNPLLLVQLDHVLHTDEISILDRFVGKGAGSDHFPVIVDFAIAAQ